MNDISTIPMTKAERFLFQKLDSLERKIDELNESKVMDSILEVSANRACKILTMGYETLIKEIESGKLRARKFKSHGEIRYKIKVSDIKLYQNRNIVSRPAQQSTGKSVQEILDEVRSKHGR
jgi:hypothetical protein